MAAFLDNVKFNPTAGGTTDWTFSTAVTGYMSPALAGIINGQKYKYFAISADLAQWELGEGAYNTGTGVLPRTTVLYNSSGSGTASGQSGAGTKISFTNPPLVAIVGLAEDIARAPNQWTRTVLTSGTAATYTTPTGCRAINVRLVGGGGGGGGGNSSSGGSGGTVGNATTFGTSLLTGNGGVAGAVGIGGGGSGGTATGGDINITGGTSGNGIGSGFGAIQDASGGVGGGSVLGCPGPGGTAGGVGGSGSSGTGSGGGGGGGVTSGTGGGGGGGSGGGYCEKLIVNPNATYTYTVGASATGGTAGGTGGAGGAGASGIIIVDEFY